MWCPPIAVLGAVSLAYSANLFIRPEIATQSSAGALDDALRVLGNPKVYGAAKARFNIWARLARIVGSAGSDDYLEFILRERTVVVRSATVLKAAVFAPGEHAGPAGMYLLQIPAATSDDAIAAIAHELLHLSVISNTGVSGLYGSVLHELGVAGASTKKALFGTLALMAGLLGFGAYQGAKSAK